MHLMASKNEVPISIGYVALAIAENHLAHDLRIGLKRLDLRCEIRPNQLEERHEAVDVALMRRATQQQKSIGHGSERFR